MSAMQKTVSNGCKNDFTLCAKCVKNFDVADVFLMLMTALWGKKWIEQASM